jgi:hypothetical protein
MSSAVFAFLTDEEAQLFFRAKGDALEIAMSMPDLNLASGLHAKVPAGATIRGSGWRRATSRPARST